MFACLLGDKFPALTLHLQLFRGRLSEKVRATIPKSIVGLSFEFTERMARGHGCMLASAKGKQQK